MSLKFLNKIVPCSIAALTLLTTDVNAQGEAIFKQTCSVCHTIGGGKLVGPDLKDVHSKRKEEWLIKFIKGSQALINSGDPDAKAIFDEYKMIMPDQNLKDEEIKTVIAFISAQSGGESRSQENSSANEASKEQAAPMTDQDLARLIAEGKAYYEGSAVFKNKGASCISCHHVDYPELMAGGTLAKDLTTSYQRLGGDAGLSGILSSPPFPAMTSAFKNNPLSPQEITAIVAFLKDADSLNKQASNSNPLLIGGSIMFILIFGSIILLWNKRKKDTVKKDIYDRQIKAIN